MCKAFSCVVTRQGKVFWQVGIDSHDGLISKFKIRDDTVDMEEISHAKIEIIPDLSNKYPYLYPDGKWTLQIDERVTPSWLLPAHKELAWEAWREWKKIIYQFNYQECLNPIHPLKLRKHKPSKQDMLNLQKWAGVWAGVWDSIRAGVWDGVGDSVWNSIMDSVWNSVKDSVWDSVRDSVRDGVGNSVGDSVWNSVGAYIGSQFPNIKKWKYAPEVEGYPYQPVIELWKRGFISSFDGKVWRLHSGKDANIVFEITKKKLAEVK